MTCLFIIIIFLSTYKSLGLLEILVLFLSMTLDCKEYLLLHFKLLNSAMKILCNIVKDAV